MPSLFCSDTVGLGLADYSVGITAAGAVMEYLEETQKTSLAHILELIPYKVGKYMLLDRNTRRNLELVETLREKKKRGSLLWVLDRTRTARGARKLAVRWNSRFNSKRRDFKTL